MGDEYQVSPDFRFPFILFFRFYFAFSYIVFEVHAPVLERATAYSRTCF